jgi:hypothetical protein
MFSQQRGLSTALSASSSLLPPPTSPRLPRHALFLLSRAFSVLFHDLGILQLLRRYRQGTTARYSSTDGPGASTLSLNGDDTEGLLQAGDRRVSGKLEIRSLGFNGALQPVFRRLDFRLEFSSARINALKEAGLSHSRVVSPKIWIRSGTWEKWRSNRAVDSAMSSRMLTGETVKRKEDHVVDLLRNIPGISSRQARM